LKRGRVVAIQQGQIYIKRMALFKKNSALQIYRYFILQYAPSEFHLCKFINFLLVFTLAEVWNVLLSKLPSGGAQSFLALLPRDPQQYEGGAS
jgi:hypothetical protein